MTPGKVYEYSELQKLDFHKILKIHEIKIVNPQKLLFLFYRRENDERLSND